jgi:hypothetical protein
MEQNQYQTLADISVKSYVEKKGGLDYLSWATAWHLLKQKFPNAQRIVYESEHTGLNYFTDGNTAYVKVGIDVNGLEHIDYLPIMDFRNNAIPVGKVNAFDVNKTIQRSTAKAIAMHGLGLSLWIGEDTSVSSSEPQNSGDNTDDSKLITLKVDDENWGRVLTYIAANKELGIEQIVKNLSVKYKVTAATKKALKSKIEE